MAEKNSLWKNLRNKAAQNKRNGTTPKAPTKQMLEQERKIKNAQTGTDNELLELFDSFAKANNKEFSSGQEVYDEYSKLNPIQQKQFLSTVKGQYNAQSLNNQEEIDEDEENVQDMALMQYGGYTKAQEGVRSPRHAETEEEKKARLAKYKKSIEQGNYNKPLYTDLDMRQSRAANVPFVKGKNAVPTELPEVTVTAPKLKYNPYRRKQVVPTRINQSTPYVADSVDDYYMQQANRLPDNIQPITSKGTKDIETGLRDIPNLTSYIKNQNVANTDNGFISSNPVTIDYNNPDEARAIQYRKLKDSQVLAPFRGSMTVQSPELYQESATPYLDNIRESRNAMLQQINPNTSTGQAVLANLYGQSLEQSNKAIGDVSRANAQNTTNWLNQRADVANKQQQFDYTNDNRYYNDVAQLQSNQDEEDINYMNSIANMNAKRLQAKNSLLNTAIMTGLPDEALHIGDNAVTFDVSKIPHNFTSPKTETATPTTKTIMIKGVPHQVYTDENGVIQAKPIEIKKTQYGGMSKYNFRKQKSQ